MKNLKILFFVLLSLVVLSSCEEDKDPAPEGNVVFGFKDVAKSVSESLTTLSVPILLEEGTVLTERSITFDIALTVAEGGSTEGVTIKKAKDLTIDEANNTVMELTLALGNYVYQEDRVYTFTIENVRGDGITLDDAKKAFVLTVTNEDSNTVFGFARNEGTVSLIETETTWGVDFFVNTVTAPTEWPITFDIALMVAEGGSTDGVTIKKAKDLTITEANNTIMELTLTLTENVIKEDQVYTFTIENVRGKGVKLDETRKIFVLTVTDGSIPVGSAFDTIITEEGALPLDSLKKCGFTTYAYFTEAAEWSSRIKVDDFMSAQLVTWSSTNGWEYAPVKYWPLSGKVSFFAYAPALGVTNFVAPTAAAADGSNPSFEFECQDLPENQVNLSGDMLVDRNQNVDGGMIKLEFSPLLSKIGFYAQCASVYPDVAIEVTSLKIIYKANAIEKSGIYTFDNDYSAYQTSAGSWAPTSPATYLPNVSEGHQVMNLPTADEIAANPALDPNVPKPIVLDNDGTDFILEKSQLNGKDKFLKLIPQTVDSGDLSIEIKYNITTGTGDEQSTTPKSQVVELPSFLWEIGKQTIYVLKFSPNGVGDIPIMIEE